MFLFSLDKYPEVELLDPTLVLIVLLLISFSSVAVYWIAPIWLYAGLQGYKDKWNSRGFWLGL